MTDVIPCGAPSKIWEAVSRTVSVPVSAGTRRHMQACGVSHDTYGFHNSRTGIVQKELTEITFNATRGWGSRAGDPRVKGSRVVSGAVARTCPVGQSEAVRNRFKMSRWWPWGNPWGGPRTPTAGQPPTSLPRRVHVLLLNIGSSPSRPSGSPAHGKVRTGTHSPGPPPGRPRPKARARPVPQARVIRTPSRCASTRRSSTRTWSASRPPARTAPAGRPTPRCPRQSVPSAPSKRRPN